jgi:hypothetical protein
MGHAGVAGNSKWNWRKRVNDLPDVVQIAIGMKVMVISNIETDLDVTNGA